MGISLAREIGRGTRRATALALQFSGVLSYTTVDDCRPTIVRDITGSCVDNLGDMMLS